MFWDVFGTSGHPVRATISDLGPVLLSRLLDLSDVQEAVLSLVFKYADDQGLLLLDLKDLRAVISYVGSNAKSLGSDYGLVSRGRSEERRVGQECVSTWRFRWATYL